MTSLRDLFKGSLHDEPAAAERREERLLDEARALRDAAIPIAPEAPDTLEPLIEAMAERRFVLLGEATHGTHEFYEIRSAISRRLIERHGFAGIVAEADWPDAARVHRYLSGRSEDADARSALGDFVRFPRWMWRNTVIVDLLERLRGHNDGLPAGTPKAGFWGMDLYSLYGSMAAVLEYLQKIDPGAARRARRRYGCFERYGNDPQAYGAAAAMGWGDAHSDEDGGPDCEDQVIEQLVELLRQRPEYARRDGRLAEEEYFSAEQNARLIANAERYYRALYRGGVNTWNLRDTHMADTLDAISQHLQRVSGGPAKLVVWAHNSHLGDARHTEVGAARGEINVGQLMRERHGEAVFALGFTTHDGTVTAADNWDEDPQLMRVLPSRPDSIERVCHNATIDATGERDRGAYLLMPPPRSPAARVLDRERLTRAIGVIYRPATERWSHYFRCRPGRQYDAIVHIDTTSALRPIDRPAGQDREAPGPALDAAAPETFPSGL